MQRLAALLIVLLLSGCAGWTPPWSASPPPAAAAPIVVWQPAGGKTFGGGLGSSQRYASPVGWIDVYVYDLNRQWATGTGDPAFAAHFESTVEEVRVYGRRGSYTDLQVDPLRDTVVAGQPFRTARFRYLRDGRAMHSITYLTARNGQLLKYRISIYADSGLDLEPLARHFVTENLRADPTAQKR